MSNVTIGRNGNVKSGTFRRIKWNHKLNEIALCRKPFDDGIGIKFYIMLNREFTYPGERRQTLESINISFRGMKIYSNYVYNYNGVDVDKSNKLKISGVDGIIWL